MLREKKQVQINGSSASNVSVQNVLSIDTTKINQTLPVFSISHCVSLTSVCGASLFTSCLSQLPIRIRASSCFPIGRTDRLTTSKDHDPIITPKQEYQYENTDDKEEPLDLSCKPRLSVTYGDVHSSPGQTTNNSRRKKFKPKAPKCINGHVTNDVGLNASKSITEVGVGVNRNSVETELEKLPGDNPGTSIAQRTITENRRKTLSTRRPFKEFSRHLQKANENFNLTTKSFSTSIPLLKTDLSGNDKSLKSTSTDQLLWDTNAQPVRLKSRTRSRRSHSASASVHLESEDTSVNGACDDYDCATSSSSQISSVLTTSHSDLHLSKDVQTTKDGTSCHVINLDTINYRTCHPTASLSSTSEDCNPRMRRFPEMTPKEVKDQAYWEKRVKNNEAARRSRRARRSKEISLKEYADNLEKTNIKLEKEIELLKAEVVRLKAEKEKKQNS